MAKSKLSRKIKTRVKELLLTFVLIIGMLLIVAGASLFLIGYHNKDIGHNLKMINLVLDVNLSDQSLQGDIYTPNELYRAGNLQQFFSMGVLVLGTFMFASGLQSIDLK